MKRFAIGAAATAIAVVAAIGSAAAATTAPPTIPLQPHQNFAGIINGRIASSFISVTGCSTATGSNGHPLAGQTAEVSRVVAILTTDGFTGRAHKVKVDLDVPASDPKLPLIRVIHLGQISSYNTPLLISPFLALPCTGTATAVFSPVDGGPKARNSVVSVSFVTPRITVGPSAVALPPPVVNLIGSGFAPNASYHVAECSQTSWVVTQNPCIGPGLDVTTDAAGAFVHAFALVPCGAPTAAPVESCYIGVPLPSGVDTVELVGAVRIVVPGRARTGVAAPPR